MKQSVRRSVAGVGAAISVIALTAAPAHATGQSLATSHPITLTNAGTITVHDTATDIPIHCPFSTGTGTVQIGTPQPNPVLQIGSVTLGSQGFPPTCADPWNTVQVTATGLPWSFSVTGSTDSVGYTPGALSGVKLTIVEDYYSCHATITGPGGGGGTITGRFDNYAGTMNVGGGTGSTSNLTVATADRNCDPGLINVGDPISLIGSYKISPTLVIKVP